VEALLEIFYLLVAKTEEVLELLKTKFLIIFIETLNSEKKEIAFKGCRLLNELSSYVSSHDKLFEMDIL
jgi:hypothetical protein